MTRGGEKGEWGWGSVMSEEGGEGQERPSPSSSSFSPHLSTFICRAIVLCLFNTSTV